MGLLDLSLELLKMLLLRPIPCVVYLIFLPVEGIRV
jgi:hypothetical protein